MSSTGEEQYFSYTRKEMLAFVPQGVSTTVEFGCSSGQFSELLKQRRSTESWGVDMDDKSIAFAQKKLDKVVKGDAFEAINQLPKNYFDCVICNDFLEHLANPDLFLSEVRAILKKDAYLVCSVPNVRYWPNFLEYFLQKDWEYKESGILDKTHLRFFTRKSLIRLFDNSSMSVEKVEGINPLKSRKFSLINAALLGNISDMRYLQFAVTAKF